MENTQPKTGKFALNYGIILGAINVVFSLMLYSMDLEYDQGIAKTIVSILILLGVIILAIVQFKKANNGTLILSQALKVGIGTALVGAIISIIYLLIYFNFIDPQFMEKSAEITKATMMEKNPELSQEQIDNMLAMQKKFFWLTYPTIIVFNLFVGFIVSLITGLAIKKSPSEY